MDYTNYQISTSSFVDSGSRSRLPGTRISWRVGSRRVGKRGFINNRTVGYNRSALSRQAFSTVDRCIGATDLASAPEPLLIFALKRLCPKP